MGTPEHQLCVILKRQHNIVVVGPANRPGFLLAGNVVQVCTESLAKSFKATLKLDSHLTQWSGCTKCTQIITYITQENPDIILVSRLLSPTNPHFINLGRKKYSYWGFLVSTLVTCQFPLPSCPYQLFQNNNIFSFFSFLSFLSLIDLSSCRDLIIYADITFAISLA